MEMMKFMQKTLDEELVHKLSKRLVVLFPSNSGSFSEKRNKKRKITGNDAKKGQEQETSIEISEERLKFDIYKLID